MGNKRMKKKAETIIRKHGFDGISVNMENRVISINGKVSSYENFVNIGLLLGSIKGVKGVINRCEYLHMKKKEKKRGSLKKIGEADAVIIGGGVTGCSIARELSRYKLNVILVEKEDDVACGTSKANNAMVHTGIGEKMGTLKQMLCVRGHKMYEAIAQELNVPYSKCGLWIILTEDSFADVRIPSCLTKFIARRIIPFMIVRRGKKLGIPMRTVNKKTLLGEEKHVTEKTLAAVYSPTYGVTCPYRFTIALAENAIENGVNIMCNTEVVDIIVKNKEVKTVVTTKGSIDTSYVINAAGLYADEIADMAGAREYTIHPRKGVTLIFDIDTYRYIAHPMSLLKFPRREHHKGGGIMPTVDGNIQWGPTITEVPDREDTSVTSGDLEKVFERYTPLMPNFPKQSVIAYFAGLRAATFTEDFVIRASKRIKGFIHVAGIQSPGLAAAPAIAQMTVDILKEEGASMEENEGFNPIRKKPVVMRELPVDEKRILIEKNSQYGKIVCRCEQVSEGEVVDAIHAPLPALSTDAIKRRTRAGMGRCQSGFCLPHIASILARETGMPFETIVKSGEGSYLFVGKAKCMLEEELC